ncbi:hypothetical protein STEG23_034523, partial [Scotinomys teguina]
LTETSCFWRIKHNEEDDGDLRNACEFVLLLSPKSAEDNFYNKIPDFRITPRTLEFFLVLIFATEEINQNPYLLPNMTLRFTITSGTCFETLKVIDSKSLPKDFYTRLLNYECGINVCDIFLTGPSWSISVKLTIGTLCPKVPTSTCSLTCTAGFRKFHEEHRADCCFDCAFCPENEVSNETDFKFTFRPCPDSLQKTDKDPNMKMCRGSLTETNCFWRIKHNEEDDGDFRNDCEFVLFLLPEPAEEDLYNTILDFSNITPCIHLLSAGIENMSFQVVGFK